MKNFSGFWGAAALLIVGHLALLGSGHRNIGPEREILVHIVVGRHERSVVWFAYKYCVFAGESFVISRHWLALGRAVCPRPARSQDVKAS